MRTLGLLVALRTWRGRCRWGSRRSRIQTLRRLLLAFGAERPPLGRPRCSPVALGAAVARLVANADAHVSGRDCHLEVFLGEMRSQSAHRAQVYVFLSFLELVQRPDDVLFLQRILHGCQHALGAAEDAGAAMRVLSRSWGGRRKYAVLRVGALLVPAASDLLLRGTWRRCGGDLWVCHVPRGARGALI